MKLGIKKIGYAERENINLRPMKTKMVVSIDTSLFKFISHTHLSGNLTSSAEPDKNGVLYDVTVTASLPYSIAAELEISKLIGSGYVFIVQDMNGNYYLIGTNHFRAEILCTHEIDGLNKNVILFTISHRSPHGELIII